jgi:hypothetical protein
LVQFELLSTFDIEKNSNQAKKGLNLGLAPNWERGPSSTPPFFLPFELFLTLREAWIEQKKAEL